MDTLALLLVLAAAIFAAPVRQTTKARAWVVTVLLLAVISQLTTVTDHIVNL